MAKWTGLERRITAEDAEREPEEDRLFGPSYERRQAELRAQCMTGGQLVTRPSEEYTRVLGTPLPPKRLAQIWAGLPERERLPFLHSLDEGLADQVMAATVKHIPRAERDPKARTSL